MADVNNEPKKDDSDGSTEIGDVNLIGLDFRPDLAFPTVSEDMVRRMKPYGTEESFPANAILYSYGGLQIDMFVILDGDVEIRLPSADGGMKSFRHYGKLEFTGEFNLLNSQTSIVEARTATESRLLRIPRPRFHDMMRGEGDIANLVVQACIWRRIGIIKSSTGGVELKGHADDAMMTLLQRFFLRNSYPCHIVEIPTVLDDVTIDANQTYPQVVLANGRTLCRPTIPELADELGITELPDPNVTYDVAVVGAGPAGLAAAVYASSEGLNTIVIEGLAPGGQAGTSSKIENYLGFPTGISGQQLASRAQLQALKFGSHFAISREAISTEPIDGIHKLILAGGIPVQARAVVVASGAQYRKLDVKNYEQYENRGLYYAATPMESLLCRGQDVIVVGGGNSAGQAALFLSGMVNHVHHIVRRSSLESAMSQYLISRILNSTRITLHTDSVIVRLEGEPTLDRVTWVNRKTGEETKEAIRSIFAMIGAEPNTGWLYGTVQLDNKGFILTGGEHGFESTPYATSRPGIYAAGDVRANSVKRVASGVGEGSVVVSDIHRYLAGHDQVPAQPNSTVAALQIANSDVEETGQHP